MAATTTSSIEMHVHGATITAMTERTATIVRSATFADRDEIVALQRLSLRALGREFYDDFVIESYLRYTPTLEEYLLADSTYYVAHLGKYLVGCGGWSTKAPAYNAVTRHDVDRMQCPRPKVRAMYVRPDFARRGIGRQVVTVIERAIIAAGYEEADVDATLAGVPLYERCGYTPVGETHASLPNGARMRFVCMHKRLVEASASDAEQTR